MVFWGRVEIGNRPLFWVGWTFRTGRTFWTFWTCGGGGNSRLKCNVESAKVWDRPFGYAQGRLFGDVVLMTPGEPWG